MDTFESDEEVGHEEEVKEATHKGVILAEDDFELDQLVVVHSLKGTLDTAPIMGQPLKFKAICLPFIIATIVLENRPITLDARYLHFMKISEEFVRAQMSLPNQQQQQKKGPQA
jgi:hypothetical protein